MASSGKFPDKQWYGVVLDGKTLCVSQSRYQARKAAREIGGMVRKVPTPKAVVTTQRM